MNFDIFNLKKVEELERELHEVKRERDAYAEDLKILRKKFEAFEEARLKMPYDCKKGPWCDACAHNIRRRCIL